MTATALYLMQTGSEKIVWIGSFSRPNLWDIILLVLLGIATIFIVLAWIGTGRIESLHLRPVWFPCLLACGVAALLIGSFGTITFFIQIGEFIGEGATIGDLYPKIAESLKTLWWGLIVSAVAFGGYFTASLRLYIRFHKFRNIGK